MFQGKNISPIFCSFCKQWCELIYIKYTILFTMHKQMLTTNYTFNAVFWFVVRSYCWFLLFGLYYCIRYHWASKFLLQPQNMLARMLAQLSHCKKLLLVNLEVSSYLSAFSAWPLMKECATGCILLKVCKRLDRCCLAALFSSLKASTFKCNSCTSSLLFIWVTKFCCLTRNF